jgi:hypothetical protein
MGRKPGMSGNSGGRIAMKRGLAYLPFRGDRAAVGTWRQESRHGLDQAPPVGFGGRWASVAGEIQQYRASWGKPKKPIR